MDAIKPVVKAIAQQNNVGETLAAFVARMVVYRNASKFRLDKALTDAAMQELIVLSTEFLRQKDAPSLETVRMQVAFDSSYFDAHTGLEATQSGKRKRLKELEKEISSVPAESAADFGAMTQVYHQIFQYLAVHADVDASKEYHDEIMREIAAALESVFPRVGLKSFVSLPVAEKVQQLKELARLILGIRLFNKIAGKGGVGIPDAVAESEAESQSLLATLQTEMDEVTEACEQYSDVLVHARLQQSDSKHALDDSSLDRLKDELTNRRQYSSYVKSLLQELSADASAIQVSSEAYRHEMEDLRRLVGSRASVPKEQVYPKFGAMASLWVALQDRLERVRCRAAVYDSLVPYQASFTPTLTLDMVKQARKVKQTMSKGKASDLVRERAVPGGAAAPGSADDAGAAAATTAPVADAKEPESKAGGDDAAVGFTPGDDEDAPTRLSLESSPEFMQLPLDCQGYCPWTIVSRNGLLLPGDPTLGVVRYRNSFYVFTSEQALVEFMQRPRHYVEGIKAAARRSPELVHLLQLQASFQDAWLPDMVRGNAAWPGSTQHPLLQAADGPAVMRDAATETPTHFVEKHIDPRYEWNEWALRRKALQLANLRKSGTTSTQTDGSHFRRENASQVYLAREQATNTGVDRGTNPPRVHRYITGLRGGTTVVLPTPSNGAGGAAGATQTEPAEAPARTGTGYARKDAAKSKPAAAVVRLQFDL